MSDFEIRLNNRSYLTSREFELTPGYSVTLKISGLHNKKHLVFSSGNDRIRLTQTANDKNIEQKLVITAVSEGSSEITSATKDIGQCDTGVMTGKVSGCFPRLTFLVLPAMGIPAGLTPRQKALVQVFLSETSTPAKGGFIQSEAREAMILMHDALYNRISSPKAKYLDVPQDGRDKLLGLIFNGRVIDGFSGGSVVRQDVQSRINDLIKYANDGNRNMRKYRTLISDAIEIAKKDAVISSDNVIGWRTKDTGLGGSNFEFLKNLQGQTFYTLKASFLQE